MFQDTFGAKVYNTEIFPFGVFSLKFQIQGVMMDIVYCVYDAMKLFASFSLGTIIDLMFEGRTKSAAPACLQFAAKAICYNFTNSHRWVTMTVTC